MFVIAATFNDEHDDHELIQGQRDAINKLEQDVAEFKDLYIKDQETNKKEMKELKEMIKKIGGKERRTKSNVSPLEQWINL